MCMQVLGDLSASVIKRRPMDRVTRPRAEIEAEASGGPAPPRPRTPPRDMARDGDIVDDLREREDAGEVSDPESG